MLDDCIRATALDHLDAYPLHVAYEVDGSKKIPIQPENGYPADITKTPHLGTLAAAEERARRLERDGKVAGCGIVLGCVGGKNLCGMDLDKCLDGDVLASWAQATLTLLKPTFVEKSLSGTGLHAYFYIAVEDRQWLLEKLGIEPGQCGKRRPINNGHRHLGPHGPALEIYTEKRYFARTDEIWPGHADVVATLDRSALENVIAAIREAWGEEESQEGSQGGGASGKWGQDRSADALRVAHALKHAGKARTLEEMMKGLLADPDPRIGDWVREKGLDRNQHELKRLWQKIWPDGDPEPESETPETPEAKVIVRGAEVQCQRKAAGERPLGKRALYAALASDANPDVAEWINTHTEQDFGLQCWFHICNADGSFDYARANGSASHEKEARRRNEAESEGDNSFNSSFRSSYKWPELGEAALHGVAGDVVRAIKPHTEGDPVAILVQYLLAVGNAMGRSAYCMVEGTEHYGNLFCVIVGKSSKARKGTGWKRVLQIVHPADADWFQCVRSGLSTGEGLIWCLRDDQDGLIDKRLLVVEEEFAKACAVMERQGNTLSVVVRDAWDGNPLEVLTKQEPAKATKTHISIVGHITENELRQRLTETSMTNGFANRFIFILAKRSNILPFGGDDLDESVLQDLISRTTNAIERGSQIKQLRFSAQAREIWQSVYPELSDDKPGLYGSITARAEAQVLRVSMIYTLLDGKTAIEPTHLHAALALWEYADKSAKYIWGDLTGDETADEILKALRSTPSGMTRTQISNLFGRNVSSGRIARALSLLVEHGKAIRKSAPSGGASGRPPEIWQAT